ncbi:MAG: OsmC family protein [Chitinophagaceae bacterium]|nr:OsmC family protein [Chitinophagaceae bacterium]
MKIKLSAVRTHGDYGITITDSNENKLIIDVPVEQGGEGRGFRPMHTLLAALIGCSSVDIISILNKQRQNINSFRVEIQGEREQGKEPSLWKTIHLDYYLEGEIEPGKAQRAAELSMNKYCSVAETLKRAGAEITFKVFVNDKPFELSPSN